MFQILTALSSVMFVKHNKNAPDTPIDSTPGADPAFLMRGGFKIKKRAP